MHTPNITCVVILYQYIHGIYNVYNRYIFVYAIDIAFFSCYFQGFVALIAHTRRRLMA